MSHKHNALDYQIQRLENSLRGAAMMVRDANSMMYSDEERKQEFEAIETLTRYLRNYHSNISKLEEYERIKDLYSRLQDDGR